MTGKTIGPERKARRPGKAATAKGEVPTSATQPSLVSATRSGGTGTTAASAEAVQAEPHRPTKAQLLQRMLAGLDGASMATLIGATGWQAHTVRAALTRLRQAGHLVERNRSEAGETVYRIVGTKEPALAARSEPPDQLPVTPADPPNQDHPVVTTATGAS